MLGDELRSELEKILRQQTTYHKPDLRKAVEAMLYRPLASERRSCGQAAVKCALPCPAPDRPMSQPTTSPAAADLSEAERLLLDGLQQQGWLCCRAMAVLCRQSSRRAAIGCWWP